MADSKFKHCKVVCFNEKKITYLRKFLPGPEQLITLADCYKAVAHPCRLAIVHILSTEECCVCDLANILRKPVSTISQHLRILKTAGLVKSRQDGKLVFYETESPEILQKLQIPGTVNEQRQLKHGDTLGDSISA